VLLLVGFQWIGPVAWSADRAVGGPADDGGDQTSSLYCPGPGLICIGPLCETAGCSIVRLKR